MKDRKSIANLKYKAQKHAKAHEKERAVEVSGDVVRGSGCGTEKGDIRKKGLFRFELKCTEKKSFSLKESLLSKIEDEALQAGEWPVFEVRFLKDSGVKKDWVVIPKYVLEYLLKGEE